MFARPFAPFRSRPVRRSVVRKTVEAGTIIKLAEEAGLGIRSLRAEPRLVKPGTQRLRVLRAEPNDD